MVQASSTLASLQKTKAVDPYALAGRIRGDYDRVQTALESRGFYAGKVIITVRLPDGRNIDGRDPALPDRLAALGNTPAGSKKLRITIKTVTGPQFHIGKVTLVAGPLSGQSTAAAPDKSGTTSTPPNEKTGAAKATQPPHPVVLDDAARKAFGLQTGQKAIAADVLAAQSGLLHALLEEGHAQANVSTPVAYLRPATQTLDLEFSVGVGPVVDIGPISFTGLERTREKFLRRRLLIHEGQLYQPSKIEDARQDLASVGIFSSVGVHDAPPLVALARGQATPGVTQAMPLRFALAEGKRHTVSGQIGYSTDLGGRVGASWTHRNLLGGAEQLKLTALVTGLGGSAQQGLGYDVYADFLKPDFLRRDQNLSLRVEGIRQLLYSYHQTAILVRGGLIRRLNKRWSINGSLLAEQENIKQFGVSTDYLIVQAPLGAVYDSTELSNPIDPATHGMRVTVNITPSESLENGSAFFTIMSASASTYFDLHHIGLSAPGRSVIAVRGLVGSVQGASTYQIPPDQRLYAGGPATVRGFRYQGVGPQNGKYGIGGTSLDAGSVEFRQRILKSFGAAAFVDAGQVGVGSRPFQGKLRVGYGAGVRYYTPIGPVRLDVALPANRPPHGDKWELYIGLGETF
ncbi:BamA/TamA family outer membrane protein [Asaia siamensis]